ncbi:MAG: sulfate adenylyltransferase [Campylobacteraceae bacterium]|nr:sulfate adenylyltransferase [Campylobacteraceae bacterium]
MASKNRVLQIDKETYGNLSIIKNEVLSKYSSLMDEHEIDEVVNSGYLNGELMPYAYIFSRDKEEIRDIKFGEVVKLELDGKIVGEILATNVFRHKGYWRFFSLFEANAISLPNEEDYNGKFCISGEIMLYDDEISKIKKEISRLKSELNLQKITALMLSANPLHRVHERLIRLTIDKADLLLIFLIRSHAEDRLEYELREKTLRFFIDKFLPREKILLIPLRDTMLFSEHKNPELECMAAHGFGANKVVLSQKHGSIGMFFTQNQAHTIIDKIRKISDIEVLVMPEYVFCNECNTIVSTKTCPHGQHHHVRYHSKTLRTLLRSGILPPAILMRKEISALILSELFPKRFENLQQIYDELFPNQGILETNTYEDFYNELAKLYQTSSLT